MKNIDYFPFQRNRYYYGKLLTESDFINEQQYVNNKRRLINRFVLGTGIVSGLKVVAIDEKNISVEAGLALDFAGREIFVTDPVIKKLELIDGFDQLGTNGKAYLCIEYDEKNIMPVHKVVMSNTDDQRDLDYDQAQEGYRLYLSTQIPEAFGRARDLYSQEVPLYENEHLRLTMLFPRFVFANEEFDLMLVIENHDNQKNVNLQIEADLQGAFYEGKNKLKLNVKQRLDEGVAKQILRCKAHGLSFGEVRVENLQVEVKEYRNSAPVQQRLRQAVCFDIADNSDFYDELMKRTYQKSYEEIMKHHQPTGICLAELSIVKEGRVYMIQNVVQAPQNSYVYTPQLIMAMIEKMRQEMSEQPALKAVTAPQSTVSDRNEAGVQMREGDCTIELGKGGTRGQHFYTDEIGHGLGLGYVALQAAVVNGHHYLSGVGSVFEEDVKVNVACRLDANKGTFVIGIELLESTTLPQIQLHWSAIKDYTEVIEASNKGIYITPGILELKILESYQLELKSEEGIHGPVKWKVSGEDAGTIYEDGLYVAPEHPGVYEIGAEYQKQKTSIFVIVRE